ncbi:60S acidic ribosomal protein P1, partial [Perkinsus olseni]
PGKVFLFYGGRATKPSPKYNAGAVVEIKYYGLGLGAALVEEVDDDPGIPHMPPHHFRTISEVKAMPYGSIVDVRGIILSCTNVTTVHIKKTDEKKAKRNYTIIDETDVIEVAVWDDKARESVITPVVAETRPVATLKSARLVEFNDGSLVAGDHTIVQVNPDILEVDTIRDWWERQSAGLGVHECQNDNGLQADVIDLMSN